MWMGVALGGVAVKPAGLINSQKEGRTLLPKIVRPTESKSEWLNGASADLPSRWGGVAPPRGFDSRLTLHDSTVQVGAMQRCTGNLAVGGSFMVDPSKTGGYMYALLLTDLQAQVARMRAYSEDLESVRDALDYAIDANERLIETLPVLDRVGERGTVRVEDIRGCASQRDALRYIAHRNNGVVRLNGAVDLIMEAGLTSGKRSSLRASLYNYVNDSNDWEFVDRGVFRLLSGAGPPQPQNWHDTGDHTYLDASGRNGTGKESTQNRRNGVSRD